MRRMGAEMIDGNQGGKEEEADKNPEKSWRLRAGKGGSRRNMGLEV